MKVSTDKGAKVLSSSRSITTEPPIHSVLVPFLQEELRSTGKAVIFISGECDISGIALWVVVLLPGCS